MKIDSRFRNLFLACLALLSSTGCQTYDGRPDNTGTGALAGGAIGAVTGALLGGRHAGFGAALGGLSGALAGGLIGHSIDEQQRTRVYYYSPQTMSKIEYNDAVASGQFIPPPPPPPYPYSTAPLVVTSPGNPPVYTAPPPPAPAPAPSAVIAPGSYPAPASAPATAPAPAPAPAAAGPAVAPPAASATAGMQALTIEDVKALSGAGVKDEVIIQAIKTSQTKFTPQDIAQMQQAGVSAAVLDFIRGNAS